MKRLPVQGSVVRAASFFAEAERLRRQLQDSEQLVESLSRTCDRYREEVCSALTQLDTSKQVGGSTGSASLVSFLGFRKRSCVWPSPGP